MSRLMSILISVVVYLTAVYPSFVQESSNCNPEVMCSRESDVGNKVINPADCKSYFVCLQGVDENGTVIFFPSDQPLSCDQNQGGTSFCFYQNSPKLSGCCEDAECANWLNFNCRNPVRECKVSCVNELDLLAYPNNCSRYYVCLPSGNQVEMGECPENLPYFNGTDCQDDVTKCCDICTPYCETEHTDVEDPTDCTRYYQCDCSKCIPGTNSTQCPEGEAFYPPVQSCLPSQGCNSICPDQ